MTRAASATAVAAVAAVAAAAAVPLARLARRSGVTDSDLTDLLPGDDLVAHPTFVVDRGLRLDAAPEEVWPWILQLGKGRAGWYFPAWIEQRLIPGHRRGLRRLDEHWQRLRLGDVVADWGPGDPEMRVAVLQPEHALVYLSKRDRDDNWRWPVDDAEADGHRVLLMSWALVLRPRGEHTVLHLRLRIRTSGARRTGAVAGVFGGLIDWITVRWLFRGLTERLEDTPRWVDRAS